MGQWRKSQKASLLRAKVNSSVHPWRGEDRIPTADGAASANHRFGYSRGVLKE